jgi:hypothetical protein
VTFSTEYSSALKVAICWQFLIAFVASTLLDGGETWRVSMIASAAFWVVAVVIILRRPASPTPSDLVYIRIGLLLAFVLAATLAAW